MRITSDREADAMYIYLVEGQHQVRTVQLTGDLAGVGNLDADEALGWPTLTYTP